MVVVKHSHHTRIATCRNSIFKREVKDVTTETQKEIADAYFRISGPGNKLIRKPQNSFRCGNDQTDLASESQPQRIRPDGPIGILNCPRGVFAAKPLLPLYHVNSCIIFTCTINSATLSYCYPLFIALFLFYIYNMFICYAVNFL